MVQGEDLYFEKKFFTMASNGPSHFRLNKKAILSLAIFSVLLVLWVVIIFHVPWSVGWRDSGEFIISAFAFDIPHPAGFPLYSMLSNLVVQLPIGPIAFRVHLFAALCGLLLIAQTYRCGIQCGSLITTQATSTIRLLAGTSAAIVALSDPFLRGTTTAEVYVLHALLILTIVRLLLSFQSSQDARHLYLAAFLGGLTIGNHVVSVLFGVWILAVLIACRTLKFHHIGPLVIFFALGLSVYGYIPIRASALPPLNTGYPATTKTFLREISDARDRNLRPAEAQDAQRSGTTKRNIASQFLFDVGRLSHLATPVIAILALLGAIFSFRRVPAAVLIIMGVPITTLLFFANWDTDPWLAALASTVTLLPLLVLAVENYSFSRVPLGLLCAAVVLWRMVQTQSIDQLKALHTEFDTPSQIATQLLDEVPRFGSLITEPSWFIVRYLQSIEGYRPDVTTTYLPSILFPGYFNPVRLQIGNEHYESLDETNDAQPQIKNLGRYIQKVSPLAPIHIEVTNVIAPPLAEILTFTSPQSAVIQNSVNGSISNSYATDSARFISDLLDRSRTLKGSLAGDTYNYGEVLLVQRLESLLALGRADVACALVKGVCETQDRCRVGLRDQVGVVCQNN